MAVDQGVTAESLPAENTVVTSTPEVTAAPSNDDTAAPSPAKDESLLDRVNAALKPKNEAPSASPGSQEAKPDPNAPSEDGEEDPDSDPDEQELARYHSKTRKQVKRLLAQRNDALDQVEKLKPDAEVGARITSFLADSGINPQEANLLLDIGRNLKRDPLKALEQIKPFWTQLQQLAGEVLPDDLQQAVQKGEITDAYARQVVRQRTENAVLSQRTQVNDRQAQERDQRQQTEQHASAVGQAISTWEATQAKADPDWSLKQDRLGELIELEIRRSGYPKTTQAAVELAEKAKTKVNAEFARLQPRKPAVNSANPVSSVRPAPAAPKTALEAVNQKLASMAA